MPMKTRQRSPSPDKGQPSSTTEVPVSASPAASPKKSRLSSLFDLFYTGSATSAQSPTKAAVKAATKEKKKISFGGPQVFKFDLESPARRRRPEGDDACIDARKLATSRDGIESLRVEVECRKEEGAVDRRIDTRSLQADQLVSLVGQEWRKDHLELLEQHGLAAASDKRLSKEHLARKVALFQELERKANLLMGGVHDPPSRLPLPLLCEELESRRIDTTGDRPTLERRLEEAWLKEGVRFALPRGVDAYAFGRHAVTARDLLEGLTDKQLRARIAAWRVPRGDVPADREERIALLEQLETEELEERRELELSRALDDMLKAEGLATGGPKRVKFERLAAHRRRVSPAPA